LLGFHRRRGALKGVSLKPYKKKAQPGNMRQIKSQEKKWVGGKQQAPSFMFRHKGKLGEPKKQGGGQKGSLLRKQRQKNVRRPPFLQPHCDAAGSREGQLSKALVTRKKKETPKKGGEEKRGKGQDFITCHRGG